MRQDFWLFLGYLLGMGNLSETVECSHGALELAVSFNKPMTVTADGETKNCSLVALGPNVPHRIECPGGWQFFGYLHPDSRLARLIQEKIDSSRRSWLYETADFSRGEAIVTGLEEPSAYRVRELWEFLLSHLLGIQSYSLGWNEELKHILEVIESLPYGELSLKAVGEKLASPAGKLADDFYRLAGIPLNHFLFNWRLAHASDRIKKGLSLDEAIAAAGLSGTASVTAYLRELYGLDMEKILTEKPLIRFFSAADYEQLSGHAL
ncbi:MAG: hypothetical protein PQJ60_06475 [Spirochaetales bacterium]|nr:hypothetical protein [Spirochaetales bacterium]